MGWLELLLLLGGLAFCLLALIGCCAFIAIRRSRSSPYSRSTQLSDKDSQLLQTPPRPGFFRKCPYCGAFFGLTRMINDKESKTSDLTGRLVFKCIKCERLVEFADPNRSPWII